MSHAILFVHGAFHGAWCWAPVMEALEARGVSCCAIDLHRGGLEADVAAIRAEIDRLAETGQQVVVVGHSLGCVSVASLTPEGIAHAVFLAGPLYGPDMPDPATLTMPDFLPSLTLSEGPTMEIDLAKAHELFYHDCSRADSDAAIAKLRTNLSYLPIDHDPPLWEQVPATYLWCDDDRAVRPDYQHQVAERIRYSEGFSTGHSPMLCAPTALADALGRVLERTPQA